MKQMKCLYTLFFALGWPISDFAAGLTPMIIKFILIGFATPIVAIYMLYEDDNSHSPDFKQILMAFFLAVLFVWFGYEATKEYEVPVIIGIVGSFAGGLSALPLIKMTRERLPQALGKVIDMLPDGIQKFFKK